MHQAKTAGRGLQPRPAQPAWGRHSGLNLPCHKFSGLQSSRIWSLGPMDYTISGQHPTENRLCMDNIKIIFVNRNLGNFILRLLIFAPSMMNFEE